MQRSRLDRTIAAWQPLSSAPLAEADAREIVEHMLGFFEVLRGWQEADRRDELPRSIPGSPTNLKQQARMADEIVNPDARGDRNFG